jgi:hypothetical protein
MRAENNLETQAGRCNRSSPPALLVPVIPLA